MKKILLFSIMTSVFCVQNMNSQITLEYSIDSVTTNGQFYCTDIGNNDFKYVMLNLKTNSFSLFNMDMSLFKTISIPLIDSLVQGYTVIYVTKSLFDCDSTNIEYAYEAPTGNLTQSFRVLREDGTLLLEVDSARGPYCFGCY